MRLDGGETGKRKEMRMCQLDEKTSRVQGGLAACVNERFMMSTNGFLYGG